MQKQKRHTHTHTKNTHIHTQPHTKIIEKALVLLGCPRTRLFLHWFYKVVREQCCLYIGFRRVVREKREKTCAKTRFVVDNPPGMVSLYKKNKQSKQNKKKTHTHTHQKHTHTHTHNHTPKSLKKHWFY